jgi:nicotinamide riboside transporter PnuC
MSHRFGRRSRAALPFGSRRTKENVWSWIIGLLNVVLAFVMFYRVQLSDMLLQIFFRDKYHWFFGNGNSKQLEANAN